MPSLNSISPSISPVWLAIYFFYLVISLSLAVSSTLSKPLDHPSRRLLKYLGFLVAASLLSLSQWQWQLLSSALSLDQVPITITLGCFYALSQIIWRINGLFGSTNSTKSLKSTHFNLSLFTLHVTLAVFMVPLYSATSLELTFIVITLSYLCISLGLTVKYGLPVKHWLFGLSMQLAFLYYAMMSLNPLPIIFGEFICFISLDPAIRKRKFLLG